MYWPALEQGWQETHNSFGMTTTGLRWGLADVRVGGPRDHQTYVLLANPNPKASEVLVRFLRRDAAPVQKAILAALSERDDAAAICRDAKGQPESDPDLRDHELVPLCEDWRAYVAREVTPFVPDAWVDEGYRDERDGAVGRVGYEINFNRYFYRYVPPRPLEVIDEELKQLEVEIAGLLREVVA